MFWRKKKIELSLGWKVALGVVFVVMLVLNGIAGSTTLLGGVNTAQVSDSNPNLFAPAGITFAMWGVIYLLLAGFVAYVLGVARNKKSPLAGEALVKVTKLAVLNMVLNSLWILAWQYQVLWLSVLLIVGILVTLIRIVHTLRGVQTNRKEYVLVRLPFSIYFGWITVATVANITTFLVSAGWKGGGVGEELWLVAVLLVAAGIGIVTALRSTDIAYLAVFVWAFAGILIKHLSPEGFNGHYLSAIATLNILIAVFISVIVQIARPQVKRN